MKYTYYLTHQTGETIQTTEASHLGEACATFSVKVQSWFPINKNGVAGAGVVTDLGNKSLTLGIYWIESK